MSAPASNAPAAAATTSTAATASSGGSAAGNDLWPIALGSVWNYKTTEPDGDDSPRTEKEKVTVVTSVADGNKATINEAVHHADGTNSGNDDVYVFHPDGSITYPLDALNASNGDDKIIVKSGTLTLPPPADLAAGKTTTTTLQIQISASGFSETIPETVTVKGEGTQSVTVPAGTYKATVAYVDLTGTVMGVQFGSELRFWFASGVGPVKSQQYADSGGGLKEVVDSELTSYTKA